jgi:hypothetical protein
MRKSIHIVSEGDQARAAFSAVWLDGNVKRKNLTGGLHAQAQGNRFSFGFWIPSFAFCSGSSDDCFRGE